MNPTMSNPIEILLVEDNPGDVRLIKEVFKDAKIFNSMQVAYDGEAAMDILRKLGKYEDAANPDLDIIGFKPSKKGWKRGFKGN